MTLGRRPQRRPVIGITMGDAAGVGPEIILKAHLGNMVNACAPVVIGDAAVLERVARSLRLPVRVLVTEDPARAGPQTGVVQVIDLANLRRHDVRPGEVSEACGRASVEFVRAAASLAAAGVIDAVASAPANKEAIRVAGFDYPGQTEIFASETGARSCHTMLVGRRRISLVTSHCSLREALKQCGARRVEQVVKDLDATLEATFGFRRRSIAVAGLNPHAGEGGFLGREEVDQIKPAVDRCRAAGIGVSGPFPADSLLGGTSLRATAFVAMYHDQGTIPLKRAGYVTYTVGLPFVRTTCGHGTAFDIAGKGVAQPELLVRAVTLAAKLALTAGRLHSTNGERS